MKDKFIVNLRIVAPVALLTCVIYWFVGRKFFGAQMDIPALDYELIKIFPYLSVLILALLGLNVIWTLVTGILLSLIIGLWTGSVGFFESMQAISSGFEGMFELSILCLIIGGVVGIIRHNGGIDYLLHQVGSRVNSPKKAELGIAFLVATVNAAIANNTIAIVIVGPLAKEIADKNKVDLKRSASILDTTSCFMQGVLPYGAQILAALAAASYMLSPFDIIQYLYYPFLIGFATLFFIFFERKYLKKVNQSV